MILPVEAWMDIRRYAPLRAAGASWKEIAAQAGCDWRTAKKYLYPDAPAAPPRASSRAGTNSSVARFLVSSGRSSWTKV